MQDRPAYPVILSAAKNLDLHARARASLTGAPPLAGEQSWEAA